jgi:hypothetical protein
MARFAFDIETVSPNVPHDEMPDFKDSNDFEFLISGLGYQPAPDADVETELIFRDGWGPEAELDVIEATLDWFEARDAETLLTFNGGGFDLLHFVGRAELASDAAGRREDLAARVQDFLERIDHDDLRDDAKNAYGGYPSLDEVCAKNGVMAEKTDLDEFGISVDALNKHRDSRSWGKAHLLNSDVPILGEQYLDLVDAGDTDAESFDAIRSAFDHYARSDIRPLFEVADARPFSAAGHAR